MEKSTKTEERFDSAVVFCVLRRSSLTMIEINKLMEQMKETQNKYDNATWITCPDCEGTKEQMVTVDDISGKIKCSTCRGTGEILDKDK